MNKFYGASIFVIMSVIHSQSAFADDGFYTKAQAEKGHGLYNNICAECHRPDLTGAAGPALIGKEFKDRWRNKPLGDFHYLVKQTMPAVNPDSLTEQEVWTITSYILQKNGFKAGDTELNTKSSKTRIFKFD